MADELLAVARSLERRVAPLGIGELAVPQGRCRIEQHPGLERGAHGLVGAAVGLVHLVAFGHVLACGGLVEKIHDVVHAIVEVRTAGEAGHRGVGAHVLVDDGHGTVPEEQLVVVERLDEVGVRAVEFFLAFGQERGVLAFELAQEQVRVADRAVQLAPALALVRRGADGRVGDVAEVAADPGLGHDELVGGGLLVAPVARGGRADRLVAGVDPPFDMRLVFHGIFERRLLGRRHVEIVARRKARQERGCREY